VADQHVHRRALHGVLDFSAAERHPSPSGRAVSGTDASAERHPSPSGRAVSGGCECGVTRAALTSCTRPRRRPPPRRAPSRARCCLLRRRACTPRGRWSCSGGSSRSILVGCGFLLACGDDGARCTAARAQGHSALLGRMQLYIYILTSIIYPSRDALIDTHDRALNAS
jgi:hypothetical protein